MLQDRFLMNYVFVFALGIGFAAGLRSLTPPAVVAWAAHLSWLNLNNSPLAFMGSTIALVIFSFLAVGEPIFSHRRRNGQRQSHSPLAFSWAVFAVPLFARRVINR
jgi:uncharacterized membrane protein